MKVGFSQRTNSCIFHDNIRWLSHKKCHPRSDHNDIKHHMTLNIILSVGRWPCTSCVPKKKKKRKKRRGTPLPLLTWMLPQKAKKNHGMRVALTVQKTKHKRTLALTPCALRSPARKWMRSPIEDSRSSFHTHSHGREIIIMQLPTNFGYLRLQSWSERWMLLCLLHLLDTTRCHPLSASASHASFKKMFPGGRYKFAVWRMLLQKRFRHAPWQLL